MKYIFMSNDILGDTKVLEIKSLDESSIKEALSLWSDYFEYIPYTVDFENKYDGYINGDDDSLYFQIFEVVEL